MNKNFFIILTLTGMSFIACKNQEKETVVTENNPFFQAYNTPFNVPAFDKIKNEHFKPAFLEGIKRHQEEIDAIISNNDAPTFENTILAMENAGKLLSEVSTVFYNLNSAHTNEEIQKIAQEISPELSAHSDNIYLNDALFQKVNTIWEQKESLSLGLEELKLLEKTYKGFVRSGAKLNDTDKETLRKINADLSLLSVNFGQNVLADTNGFEMIVDNEVDLAGLPEGIKEAAAETAKDKGHKGKWIFTVHNSSVMPFLQYSANRDLRAKMYTAYKNRGNNGGATDNNENAVKMANLRLEKANLLGYETYAHYALEETMAKTPEKVNTFLMDLWKPALTIAKNEIAEIKTMMNAEGIQGDVAPWDYSYYSEKIRKAKFDLDEQELTPYFSIENVQEGVFMVTEKLWGLQYKKLDNVPTYHPDATVWEVLEANGDHLGILYMDMHPRASKRGGAWMTSYRSQTTENGARVAPVISIVCNFTKPTASNPSLLTFDEVTTFFHEFGHALHGLMSNVTYQSLAGTSVSRDFVELPSQVMENWAADPVVLKMYAKHYKTGEVIPDVLIEKLEKAGTFGQGFTTSEYLASALLDMDYHSKTEVLNTKASDFENASMAKFGLPSAITPRHSSTHFGHIFAGGYSAGYSSYIWSGVLDTDAFEQFKNTDLFDQDKAQSFRKNILERGGTEDPMELYKRFRGGEPSIQPLLKKRGLDKKS
jgi:peptidyl-dipeptidase Dcp